MSEKLLLTISEAAELLSLSRATLYRALARGDVRAVHVGRSVRISRTELERFVRVLEEAATGVAVAAGLGARHG